MSLAFWMCVHSMRSQVRQHLPTASRPCSAVESIFLPIAAPCSRGDTEFTRCTLSGTFSRTHQLVTCSVHIHSADIQEAVRILCVSRRHAEWIINEVLFNVLRFFIG